MKTALEILRCFRAMRVAPVAFDDPKWGTGQWLACSQYGFTLAEFASRKDALRYVLNYYAQRMHLIRQ